MIGKNRPLPAHKRVIRLDAVLECLAEDGLALDPGQLKAPAARVKLTREYGPGGGYCVTVDARLPVRRLK